MGFNLRLRRGKRAATEHCKNPACNDFEKKLFLVKEKVNEESVLIANALLFFFAGFETSASGKKVFLLVFICITSSLFNVDLKE